MISVDVARLLRDAGLTWTPVRGDRFVVLDRGMDADVFVLSDMTIEVHQFPTGPVIGFNGTTEWALDSLEQRDALWLPTEHQLRELIGAAFVQLVRLAEGFRVDVEVAGERQAFEAPDASDAYAGALLAVPGVFRVAASGSHSAEWAP